MNKSQQPPHGTAQAKRAPGRPPRLSAIEVQRYVTLRNWGFSQREAGALARNLPRGRRGLRPTMGASTCQRLDNLHGPFAEAPQFPRGHDADSLRKLPQRALVALADARGDVHARKYQEAAGFRGAVKRAKRPKPSGVHDVPLTQASRFAETAEESVTYRAWHRAQFVEMAFSLFPARTMDAQLKNVREWCREWSVPVELDAAARRHLTPWERIAATWDGEFIADADRKTFLLPFRNEMHPNISPASREAILLARSSMHSERPSSTRGGWLVPSGDDGDDAGDDVASVIHAEVLGGASAKQAAAMRAAARAERLAAKRIRRWAGDDAGEGPVGPFDVDYDEK